MKTTHWAILGGLLTSIALQIAGLNHGSDALHPAWVAGTLGVLGANLTAMFAGPPRASEQTRATDRQP